MKKIPTIFERDWTGDRSLVTSTPNPAADWVFRGDGIPTIKLDGTSCMVRGGKLFKRRELRGNTPWPEGFELADEDPETGKIVGWMPVTNDASDQYHREAYSRGFSDGTYELIGPKIQGNPEHWPKHELIRHGMLSPVIPPPIEFEALRNWLSTRDIEGIVWHHPDGRMAKIKLRDFGLRRPGSKP